MHLKARSQPRRPPNAAPGHAERRAPVPAARCWTSGLHRVRGPDGSALPVDRHHLLVTDDPGIVSRRQRGDLTGPGLELGAVGHDLTHLGWVLVTVAPPPRNVA